MIRCGSNHSPYKHTRSTQLYSFLEIVFDAIRDAILVSLDEDLAILVDKQFLDAQLLRSEEKHRRRLRFLSMFLIFMSSNFQ